MYVDLSVSTIYETSGFALGLIYRLNTSVAAQVMVHNLYLTGGGFKLNVSKVYL